MGLSFIFASSARVVRFLFYSASVDVVWTDVCGLCVKPGEDESGSGISTEKCGCELENGISGRDGRLLWSLKIRRGVSRSEETITKQLLFSDSVPEKRVCFVVTSIAFTYILVSRPRLPSLPSKARQ